MDKIQVLEDLYSKEFRRKEIENGLKRINIIGYLAGVFLILAVMLVILLSGCGNIQEAQAQTPCPANLYMGLIAEDTKGDYQTYLAIASVVRNRIDKGLNHGLVALKRKGISDFVSKEVSYAKRVTKIDLIDLSQSAIKEVWQGKDYSNGATHYEHTGKYPVPYWAKKMQVVKVMFKGTKNEITFWKGRS
jgi:hypothetical protein